MSLKRKVIFVGFHWPFNVDSFYFHVDGDVSVYRYQRRFIIKEGLATWKRACNDMVVIVSKFEPTVLKDFKKFWGYVDMEDLCNEEFIFP